MQLQLTRKEISLSLRTKVHVNPYIIKHLPCTFLGYQLWQILYIGGLRISRRATAVSLSVHQKARSSIPSRLFRQQPLAAEVKGWDISPPRLFLQEKRMRWHRPLCEPFKVITGPKWPDLQESAAI